MPNNTNNIYRAFKNRNDEFYTLMSTVEEELQHYTDYLKDKIIYCNCDNSNSNFVKYFSRPNICKDLIYTDIDFRSDKSIELLNTADIVITNPPFSLFREYVKQLTQYKKEFLIIGNILAISYEEVFPLIKDNKIRFGISMLGCKVLFRVPNEFSSEGYSKGLIVDNEGFKYISMSSTRWYTNLKCKNIKYPPFIKLTSKYNTKDYPKYDNYNAIEVSRVTNIPKDYEGVMGVAVSFMDKYNPNQFEILGMSRKKYSYDILNYKSYKDYQEFRQDGSKTGEVGSRLKYAPTLVQNNGRNNYYVNKDGKVLQHKFRRIFIRNRNPILEG